MRYRLKCLTPLLVGDGRKLCPIDYMVWKDQVNVLDQWRIFRILAKGPRLDSYLAQLKNAEKLDFASWGGFAQITRPPHSLRERRLFHLLEPRRRREPAHPHLCHRRAGPYLPATAIKGALRTGMLFAHWRDGMLQDTLARVKERVPRRPAEMVEEQALGPAGSNRMRFISAGDSAPIATSRFQSTCCAPPRSSPRGGGALALGWKQSPRGAVDGARPEESTPTFAEMAVPAPPSRATGTRRPSSSNPKCAARSAGPRPSTAPKSSKPSTSTPRACWRCSANTPPGPAWACSTGVWTSWSSGSAAPAREALVSFRWDGAPVFRQELLAGRHQPGLPPDPGAIRLLQPRAGVEPALPQDPPHRVLEQQAGYATRLGGTQHRG